MMTTMTLPRPHTPKTHQKASDSRAGVPRPYHADALNKAAVAELSPAQIDGMSRADMVRVIRAARMPLLRPDVEQHLEEYDRATLQRLVYLARRTCRHQGY